MTTRACVLFLLAACGHDAAAPDAPRTPDARVHLSDATPDARPDAVPSDAGPDLACLGHAPSTTANDPVAFGGTVFAVDNYQLSQTAGASISLLARSNNAVLATASSGSDGSFTMSIESHGVPVDAYFTVTVSGDLPSRVDPGTPLLGGENALLLAAADAEVARWYADAGSPYVAGTGALIGVVVDCETKVTGNSTVASAPTGQAVYYDDGASRWSPTLTASTNGYALVIGASASPTLTPAIATRQLPSRTVEAPTGTVSLALLPPTTPPS
jgi:hypothetical protein